MLKKIRSLPLIAYLGLVELARGVKEDERGLSGVVVAVLLILIAVLAIVLIWGFLSGWLSDLWAKIIGESAAIG